MKIFKESLRMESNGQNLIFVKDLMDTKVDSSIQKAYPYQDLAIQAEKILTKLRW